MNEIIGGVLRDVRHAARLTLSEVEERSGGAINKSRLASYERGNREIKVDTLIALAPIYGTTPTDLLRLIQAGVAA